MILQISIKKINLCTARLRIRRLVVLRIFLLNITTRTTRITKWTRNDDQRLKRLMEYMNATAELHKLKCFVCDNAEDIELWLFVDADFAGDKEDTKSSTGGYIVLV